MMVVRFDSDHTDSEFRKVWPGMAGKLVVSSIQIDLAFLGSRREDAASSAHSNACASSSRDQLSLERCPVAPKSLRRELIQSL